MDIKLLFLNAENLRTSLNCTDDKVAHLIFIEGDVEEKMDTNSYRELCEDLCFCISNQVSSNFKETICVIGNKDKLR
jgi:hypothetical protein